MVRGLLTGVFWRYNTGLAGHWGHNSCPASCCSSTIILTKWLNGRFWLGWSPWLTTLTVLIYYPSLASARALYATLTSRWLPVSTIHNTASKHSLFVWNSNSQPRSPDLHHTSTRFQITLFDCLFFLYKPWHRSYRSLTALCCTSFPPPPSPHK